MRVLLTNDDGIAAPGLQALRRSLLEIDGIELSVIAPDSNRSATARSITTRSPLWVEEITFEDGTAGYATDGTPVDCVRFAELGLIGQRPELIVSGINHGSNLGDDVTYSGTVAAALEGIVLGIPAIAVSQQSLAGEMDFRLGREFDFSVSAPLAAALAATIGADGLPEGTLLNVNCPGGKPKGVDVSRLGKRLYNDELKQVDEDSDGRRRYQIYGYSPGFEDQEGTDLAAVSRGYVAITPIHFDLTDHGGFDRVREMGLEDALERVLGSVGA
ncbi:MAG: 5'/3'-nucleotidase SurE [Solirubrobacterales bacterium]|nr:5'/3'-nucleotidase SurE [Solirubrobacterales bacterium]